MIRFIQNPKLLHYADLLVFLLNKICQLIELFVGFFGGESTEVYKGQRFFVKRGYHFSNLFGDIVAPTIGANEPNEMSLWFQ